MVDQRGGKVNDQEVGSILNFNPSDCSHWKRGEKNVKSVFALTALANTLGVEPGLIFDIASGAISMDEAFFEYQETKSISKIRANVAELDAGEVQETAEKECLHLLNKYTLKQNSQSAPLYVPEVMRFFAYINMQTAEMMDKLTRILESKARSVHYPLHKR